jgi:hypothetical protein
MFKSLAHIALALVLAIGGGSWLTYRSVTGVERLGGIEVGLWKAFPDFGTPEADPYAKARAARSGSLPLGAAEGIRFYAEKDSQGRALIFGCDYLVEGPSPAARLWTLYASANDEAPLAAAAGLPSVLHSRQIIRIGEKPVTIHIAPSARPGNWLAVSSKRPGAYHLVLSLYDTPVATNAGLVDMKFPDISRLGCDG